MNIAARLREFVTALRVFVGGVIAYALSRGRRKEVEEFCHICHALGKPLQRGSYMIRTGPRNGAAPTDSFSELAVSACYKHHPDHHVEGAEWADETQSFLQKLNVAALCVYLYRSYRQ